MCLCAEVVRIENRTRVVVVQHPRERRHPFNTVRLLELCLTRTAVFVDYTGDLRRGERALPDLEHAALLYPGPNARPLSTLSPSERPTELVVIDGTWHHAHSLYRDIGWLKTLPQVTLDSVAPSEFAIRRQPASHCLSTLEAVHASLTVLEPETSNLDAMRELFRTMVRQQLGLSQRSGRARKARRQRVDVPRALSEDFEHLVVAYAETAYCDGSPRELITVSAERLATGERFDVVFRRDGVNPAHLAHMGMQSEDLARGLSLAEFRERWQRFVRSTDIVGVWSDTTLSALSRAGAVPGRSVVLKASYRRYRDASGGMDEIAEREGLTQAEGSAGPRRHRRLANAVAVARLLHEAPESKPLKERTTSPG